MSYVLHPELIDAVPFSGRSTHKALEERAGEIKKLTKGLKDPDISIVIRTKNDIGYIKQLFEDIEAQDFSGKKEIILVDTNSTDGTAEYAKKHGAKVLSIKQKDFTYPKALNMGFKGTKYPYVLTIVGHSCLVTSEMFKTLTYWVQKPRFGGMYSFPLPSSNASLNEKLGSGIFVGKYYKQPVIQTNRQTMGTMAANSSIVSRDIWEKAGGYDEAYAAGGEEISVVNYMLLNNRLIVLEPLSSVHHSHGLGPINSIKQGLHWAKVANGAYKFNQSKVLSRRPDLKKKLSS